MKPFTKYKTSKETITMSLPRSFLALFLLTMWTQANCQVIPRLTETYNQAKYQADIDEVEVETESYNEAETEGFQTINEAEDIKGNNIEQYNSGYNEAQFEAGTFNEADATTGSYNEAELATISDLGQTRGRIAVRGHRYIKEINLILEIHKNYAVL